MRKNEVDKIFEALYESTYDDAVAYIGGSTGNLAIMEDLLFSLYSQMYEFLLNSKIYDENLIKGKYIETLKNIIAPHLTDDTNIEITSKRKRTINSVEKNLETEFYISETDLFESEIIDEIIKFISGEPSFVQKIFILYFYCNYDAKNISELLSAEENDVTHIIYALLKEIRDTYLKNKITKPEVNA